LSAASPHTASLCRRHHRVPGGGRSASSLRTSRGMTAEISEPSTRFGVRIAAFFDRRAHMQQCPELPFISRPSQTPRCTDRPRHIIFHDQPPPIPTPNTFLSNDRPPTEDHALPAVGYRPIGAHCPSALFLAARQIGRSPSPTMSVARPSWPVRLS
jgi:hypothetical protein